jgi:hypothetical protein
MDTNEISLKLLLWSVENMLKILFGFGFIWAFLKVLFLANTVKIVSWLTFYIYSSKYNKHRVFRKIEDMKNKTSLKDLPIISNRSALIKDILMIEYQILYTFLLKITNCISISSDPSFFKHYETNPDNLRDYILKELYILRHHGLEILEVNIPDKIIQKYYHIRNLIYEPLEIMVIILTSEYRFTPMILWGFLNGAYVLTISMNKSITSFVNSLNGDLEGFNYTDSDGKEHIL